MSKNEAPGNTRQPGAIDWDDLDAVVIDGFTVAEIIAFSHDTVVEARCALCEATHSVEPDARDYRCPSCGQQSAITSPLIKLGLI